MLTEANLFKTDKEENKNPDTLNDSAGSIEQNEEFLNQDEVKEGQNESENENK